MPDQPKPYRRFGELLTQGIKRLANEINKPVGNVHNNLADTVGCSPTTLHTWRRGEYLPNDPIVVENIAKFFVQKGGFGAGWIQVFFQAAQFGPKSRIEELHQAWFGQPSAEAVSPVASLPQKPYHELVGREAELDEVVACLTTPGQYRLVAVTGLGGMGKTALAHQVVEVCQARQVFEYVVWYSAKIEFFESETILKREQDVVHTLDDILSDIGRQCDRPDIAQLPPDQRQAAVQWLLQQHRALIVLDNLETVPDNETLVRDLFQMLGQSKILITSRHHLKYDQVYNVKLEGLQSDKSVELLRKEATARKITVVQEADDAPLNEIHTATGGAPLALKLVVGQLSRQPMQVVLDELKRTSSQGQDYDFYRFLYWQSWQLLSETAQEVLVDMSVFPPITGGAVNDVVKVSQVSATVFWPALDQLIVMSLVDHAGSLEEVRYALHPLTHYFILSDITEEWRN